MENLIPLNKSLLATLVAGLALAIASKTALADSPSFSNGAFTTDSVLDLAGTEVYGVALNQSNSTITTANGYSFLGQYNSGGDISNIEANGSYNAFIPAETSGDAGFDSVLQDGSYGLPVTYTLNDLTGGLTYNVLVFMADDRSSGGFKDFTLTDGPQTMGGPSYTGDDQNFFFPDGTGVVATHIPAGDPATTDQVEGGYVLDTFTEALNSTTHDITIGTPNSGIEISGILVGTPLATTPEPSSIALLLFGVGAALFLGRSRIRQS